MLSKILLGTSSGLLLFFTVITNSIAGQVGTINSFSSGTPAVAAEVNDNFTELSNQVNDNDVRINNLGSGLQTSVGPESFDNHVTGGITGCFWNKNGYWTTTSNDNGGCQAVTGISIPNGVSVNTFACAFRDSTTGASMFGQLIRRNMTTGEFDVIFSTASTVDSPNIQELFDTTPSSAAEALIDNRQYTYAVNAAYISSSFGSISTNARVHGCYVLYN